MLLIDSGNYSVQILLRAVVPSSYTYSISQARVKKWFGSVKSTTVFVFIKKQEPKYG